MPREIKQDCQRQTTHHEWVVEEIDKWEDIIDSDYFPTIEEALFSMAQGSANPEEFHHYDWGLHRASGSEAEGTEDRQYAYVKDGQLPTHYDGGNIVPKKQRAMFDNATGEIK